MASHIGERFSRYAVSGHDDVVSQGWERSREIDGNYQRVPVQPAGEPGCLERNGCQQAVFFQRGGAQPMGDAPDISHRCTRLAPDLAQQLPGTARIVCNDVAGRVRLQRDRCKGGPRPSWRSLCRRRRSRSRAARSSSLDSWSWSFSCTE